MSVGKVPIHRTLHVNVKKSPVQPPPPPMRPVALTSQESHPQFRSRFFFCFQASLKKNPHGSGRGFIEIGCLSCLIDLKLIVLYIGGFKFQRCVCFTLTST